MTALGIILDSDSTSESLPIKADFPRWTLSWMVEKMQISQLSDISQNLPIETPSPNMTSSPILVPSPIFIPILKDCLNLIQSLFEINVLFRGPQKFPYDQFYLWVDSTVRSFPFIVQID